MKFSPQLPHFYNGHNCFFITFRLEDSLPQSIVKELKEELQREINEIKEENEAKKKLLIEELKTKYFRKYEHQLDNKPYGDCVLKEEKIAKILYDKIISYHTLLYYLKCFSIMPNHVHLLISTLDKENIPALDKWLQLIKGGSAFLINKELKRVGRLWAGESFDRYIRDEFHYSNSFYYTINNPVLARLNEKYLKEPYMFRCDQISI
jgi:putative transposase